jgi:RND family efflux transporter MFP subunit
VQPPFRILALCVGMGALLAVSCGKTGRAPARGPGNEPPRPVRVTRAEVRPMELSIAVTGTLCAQEQSTLSAKVAGRLARVLVDVRSVVRQGDLLAQIEPRDYELSLQRAAAALAQTRAALGLPLEGEEDRVELEQVTAVKQAKAVWEEAVKNRDRVSNLSRAGIAPQSEWDTAEANHTVAQAKYETAREDARTRMAALAGRRAELETARQQVADAAVRAPYEGAVQARMANTGEYLAAGTPLLKIVKTDPLRLRLEVPERECGLVGTGQWVRLQIESNTNLFTGRIARLSPAITEQSRMLVVEADVPSRGVLRPGLFARAQVVIREQEPGLSVPANALLTFAGIEKVIGITEGKAVEKMVTTGRRGPGWIEVLSGLASGEAVVLEPGGLRTGQPVIPNEATRAPQTAGVEPASGR